MTLASIGRFIQNLSLFTAVRESRLVYPTLLATHLACIATFGGLILATNLRLMGRLLNHIPADAVIRALRPWKQAGFVIMVTMGLLLGGSKAEEYLTNPYFQLKMACLLAIAAHGLWFRRTVYRSQSPIRPRAARAAGLLSLILWLAVVSMGRWIAYYDLRPPAEQTSGVAAR